MPPIMQSDLRDARMNKGEWTEFIAPFMVLQQGMKIGNRKIRGFLSTDQNGRILRFQTSRRGLICNGGLVLRLEGFSGFINRVQNGIRVGSGSFSVPEIQESWEAIGCPQLKAPPSEKADIIFFTGGFPWRKKIKTSIKSLLGGSPSLLNSSVKSTKVWFTVDTDVIQNLEVTNDRTMWAVLGPHMQYDSFECDVFHQNLLKISDTLPKTVANLLLAHFTKGQVALGTTKGQLQNDFAKLVVAALTGLTPSKPYSGINDVDAICVVDGKFNLTLDSVANFKRNPLFQTARTDSPSITRHQYGSLIETRIAFNLSIRL